MNSQTQSYSSLINILQRLSSHVEELFLLLSEKEKIVIINRFNIHGQGKKTLEEIGREFGVTRERIRQIENNALTKMKRVILNTDLKILNDYVWSIVQENGGILKTQKLTEKVLDSLDMKNKVNISELNLLFSLHENLESLGNTISFYPYVIDKNYQKFSLKELSDKLVNQIKKYENIKNIIKVHSDFKNNSINLDFDFDLPKMKSLIDIDKRILMLKDEMVGLMEWRHINPRTLRDKILYILRRQKQPLHFRQIAEIIKENRFNNRSVNLQAIHNELIRHDNFVLIGRGIYALSDWGYERGTVAEVVQKILEKEKELDQEEIVKKVLTQRKVKKITIILALKNSDLFERVGRKRYRLRKK